MSIHASEQSQYMPITLKHNFNVLKCQRIIHDNLALPMLYLGYDVNLFISVLLTNMIYHGEWDFGGDSHWSQR